MKSQKACVSFSQRCGARVRGLCFGHKLTSTQDGEGNDTSLLLKNVQTK